MLVGIKKFFKHLHFFNYQAKHSSIPPVKERKPTMKDIILLNASNTYNYGTMALAQNFIHYMRASISQPLRFYIDALDFQHAIRLRNATSYYHIFNLPYGYKKRPRWFFYDFIFRIHRLIVELKAMRSRSVVFLGNDGCERLTFKKLMYIKISTRIARVSFVNWSAIPYSGIKKRIITKLFKNLPIFTRDDWSYQYLTKELGAKRVKAYSDMRLLELSEHQTYTQHVETILCKFNLEKGHYITLVPMVWDHCCDDRRQYITLWSHIAQYILDHYPNKHLVLLPTVIWPPFASDLGVIHRVFLKINRKDHHRIVLINSIITANESRLILGMGHFAICSRASAALSTYQMGTPAIMLSSDIINRELIQNDLKLQELVIDTQVKGFYTEDPCQKVIDTIHFVDSHFHDLKDCIAQNVYKKAKEMYVNHGDIAKVINK